MLRKNKQHATGNWRAWMSTNFAVQLLLGLMLVQQNVWAMGGLTRLAPPREEARVRITTAAAVRQPTPGAVVSNRVAIAQAQIQRQIAAGQPATTAVNGVPVVNIVAPNSNGVSHNQYPQFNVGSQGLVLNNATGTVNSQLAGAINANPNLTTSARLIINEVTGPVTSSLLGPIEIAGQYADMVLANPYGITCNGCRFINTPRVTLTTGVPNIQPDGGLRFDVAHGSIRIGPGGLNVAQAGLAIQQLDLIGKQIVIDGAVQGAMRLNVVGAEGSWNYEASQWAAKAGTASAGAVAIDASAFADISAGSVHIIATDQGAGVRLGGSTTAWNGTLTVNAQGDLTTVGTVSARDQLSLAASGTINNSGGTLYSGGNLNLESSQAVINRDGFVVAQGQATIVAKEVTNSEGSVVSAKALSIQADKLVNSTNAAIQAGAATLQAKQLDNRTASINVDQLQIKSDRIINDEGYLASSQTFSIQTGSLSNRNGIVETNSLSVNTASLDNRGGQITASGQLALTVTGDINNSGKGLIGGKDIKIDATNIANGSGGTIGASEQINIRASNTIDNSGGAIVASDGKGAGSVIVEAAWLKNNEGKIQANQRIDLDVQQVLDNSRKGVVGGETVTINAGSVLNEDEAVIGAGTSLNIRTGFISNLNSFLVAKSSDGRGGSLVINASHLVNRGGVVQAAGENRINLRGDLDNSQNGIILGAETYVNARDVNNASKGVIGADKKLEIKAGVIDNQLGQIGAVKNGSGVDVSITAQTLDNREGIVQAGNALKVDIAGDLSNAKGTLFAARTQVSANRIDNSQGGQIAAAQGVSLVTQQLDNTGGTVAASDGKQSGDISIDAVNLFNAGGKIQALNNLGIRTASTLSVNSPDQLVAQNGALRVDANAFESSVMIAAGGGVDIKTEGSIVLNDGIVSNGSIRLDASNGPITIKNTIYTPKDLYLRAWQRDAPAFEPWSFVTFDYIDYSAAKLLVGGDFTLSTNLALSSSAGRPSGITLAPESVIVGNRTIEAGGFANSGGVWGGLFDSSGDLTLRASRDGYPLFLNWYQGMSAVRDLTIDGFTLDTHTDSNGLYMYAGRDLNIRNARWGRPDAQFNAGRDINLEYHPANPTALEYPIDLMAGRDIQVRNTSEGPGFVRNLIAGRDITYSGGQNMTNLGYVVAQGDIKIDVPEVVNFGLIEGQNVSITADRLQNGLPPPPQGPPIIYTTGYSDAPSTSAPGPMRLLTTDLTPPKNLPFQTTAAANSFSAPASTGTVPAVAIPGVAPAQFLPPNYLTGGGSNPVTPPVLPPAVTPPLPVGVINARGNLNLDVLGPLLNHGVINAGGDARIRAGTFTNTGTVNIGGNANIVAEFLNNLNLIRVGGNADFQGGSILNTGLIDVGGNLSFNLRDGLTNQYLPGQAPASMSGVITAGGNLTLNVPEINNIGGFIQAGRDIRVNGNYRAQDVIEVFTTREDVEVTLATRAQLISQNGTVMLQTGGPSGDTWIVVPSSTGERQTVIKVSTSWLNQVMPLILAAIVSAATSGLGSGIAVGLGAAPSGVVAAFFEGFVASTLSALATGQDMDQALRAGLLGGMTAGLSNQLNTWGVANLNLDSATRPAFLSGAWAQAATVRAALSGALNRLIYGNDFDDAFRASLISSLEQSATNWVGNTFANAPGADAFSTLQNAGAHAAVGCGIAVLRDLHCGTGAVAASSAALINRAIDELMTGGNPNSAAWGDTPAQQQRNRAAALSLLTPTVVSALAYGLNRDVVQAFNAAQNETLNNYLTPKQVKEFAAAMRACGDGAASETCRQQVTAQYQAISDANNSQILACTTTACVQAHIDLANQGRAEAGSLTEPLARSRVLAWQGSAWSANGRDGLALQQLQRIGLANEFAQFQQGYCQSESLQSCAQRFADIKSGTVNWLRDLQSLARDLPLSLADSPDQPPWKVLLGVTGMTLAALIPTTYNELLLTVGPTALSRLPRSGQLPIGSAADNLYSSTRPVEEVFPELAGINPHYVPGAPRGVNTNCTSCANAVDARLTGRDPNATADPSSGYGNWNDLLPSSPFGQGTVSTVEGVEQQLLARGNGATIPVVVHQPGTTLLHSINGVNRNGVVYFVDGQIGKIVVLPPGTIVTPGRK